MKIGRKYFEIEDETDVRTEQKKEIEPLENAVVNDVKPTKRSRKAKGEE